MDVTDRSQEMRCCWNDVCGVRWWLVSSKPLPQGSWWVGADATDTGFLVLAPRPLCPFCGNELQTRCELEGGIDPTSESNDHNPFAAFVRGLSQQLRR